MREGEKKLDSASLRSFGFALPPQRTPPKLANDARLHDPRLGFPVTVLGI